VGGGAWQLGMSPARLMYISNSVVVFYVIAGLLH
jgi:hypothetical protein